MKPLIALGILVAGAVAAFAVYTFGGDDETAKPRALRRPHVFTLRQGDTVRIPAAAATCQVSGEAGIPNFFCTHTGRTRYQAVLWTDRADLYDLARHGEPMVPTYSVPSKPSP